MTPTAGRWRRIHCRMWHDERFRELSSAPANAQTLWVYLLTGPHTTSIPGLACAGEAALAEALGWPLEDTCKALPEGFPEGYGKGFRNVFAELSGKGMVKADWKARIIWIPNAVHYDPPASPNVVLSWRSVVDELPESPVKTEAIQALQSFCQAYGEAFCKAFAKAFGQGLPESRIQNTDTRIPPKAPQGAGVSIEAPASESIFPQASITSPAKTPAPSPASTETPKPTRGRKAAGAGDEPAGFVRFWQTWPSHKRKADRDGCARIWRAKNMEAMAGTILAGLRKWIGSADWQKDSGEFVPAPATWLRQRRWESAAALEPAADSDAWPGQITDPDEIAKRIALMRETAEDDEADDLPAEIQKVPSINGAAHRVHAIGSAMDHRGGAA